MALDGCVGSGAVALEDEDWCGVQALESENWSGDQALEGSVGSGAQALEVQVLSSVWPYRALRALGPGTGEL